MRRAYPFARVYILDTKDYYDFDDYDTYRVRQDAAPPALAQPGAIQLWTPKKKDLAEIDSWLESIFEHKQPSIVVIDELSSVVSNGGQKYPDYLDILLKQGRAPGMSVIVLTQEAAYIPRNILGQATHLFRFRLNDDFDAQKIDKKLGIYKTETERKVPDKHGFWYRRLDDTDPPLYYNSSDYFFI